SSFLGLIAFIAIAVGLFALFKKRVASRSQNQSAGTGFAQKTQAHNTGFADAAPAYAATPAGVSINKAQPEPSPSAQYSQQAQASSSHNNAGFAQGGFVSENDVPHNLPAGFDADAFVNGAREHYRILQKSWDNNQFDTIKEYVSPELYSFLVAERAKSPAQQTSEVLFVDAQIVRADHDEKTAQISLQFSGRYRDVTMQEETAIEDVWHLERKLSEPNAPWIIVGIENT
ncbi:MAG: Tim44 domain-containing protein, partial [Enterovibrio sp.]